MQQNQLSSESELNFCKATWVLQEFGMKPVLFHKRNQANNTGCFENLGEVTTGDWEKKEEGGGKHAVGDAYPSSLNKIKPLCSPKRGI